jgi:hypothetical protein
MKEEEIYEDELDFIVESWDEKDTPPQKVELSPSELEEYYAERYVMEYYDK